MGSHEGVRWISQVAGALAGMGMIGMTALASAAASLAPAAPSARVRSLVQAMTIEQKAGQILHVGFPGMEVGPEVTELVRRHYVGGVILFARNVHDPAQVARLTNALQEMAARSGAGIPLLVSVDQEGGVVARLVTGATVFPGNMALGATGSEQLAYEAGLWTGRELRAVGIHQNYAPVVDVNNNPSNPVIGVRSFGEDPAAVSRLGAAMVRGLQAAGVLATAKHFPGHGDTEMDSHIDLPTVPHPMDRLERVELAPFRAAIQAGVASVMTAHITFPAVEPAPGLPATLSRRVLTDLLREEMGFRGLVVTDAIEMGAIVKHWGIGQAAVRAVQAGADAVLVAWPADWTAAIQVARALVEAARSGEIPTARLDEAVARILAAKEQLGLLDGPSQVDVAKVQERVGTDPAFEKAMEIARRSITLLDDPSGLVPFGPGVRRVLVLVPKAGASTGVENPGARYETGLGAALAAVGGYEVIERVVATSPRMEDVQALESALQSVDAVVVATYRAWEGRYSGQADLVRAAWTKRGDRPVAVVALREPYDLGRMPKGPALLATYGTAPASLLAAAEAIAGRLSPQGTLPVTIPGRWEAGHRWQPTGTAK